MTEIMGNKVMQAVLVAGPSMAKIRKVSSVF